MRRRAVCLLPLVAAACAQPAQRPPATVAPPPPAPGLERVLGRTAEAVVTLLGPPTLDRREGPGRHLQFARGACVLDLFLYPSAPMQPSEAPGAAPSTAAARAAARSGPAVVTHAAARLPDGRAMAAQACLASQIGQQPVG